MPDDDDDGDAVSFAVVIKKNYKLVVFGENFMGNCLCGKCRWLRRSQILKT